MQPLRNTFSSSVACASLRWIVLPSPKEYLSLSVTKFAPPGHASGAWHPPIGEQLYRRFDVAGVGEVVRESPLVADGFDVVGAHR